MPGPVCCTFYKKHYAIIFLKQWGGWEINEMYYQYDSQIRPYAFSDSSKKSCRFPNLNIKVKIICIDLLQKLSII
jgi:hypothetical protein